MAELGKITDYKPNDIQGWMGPDEQVWLYEQAKQMQSVVEVGSWKGRSTHALLSGCPGPVFAVDHFKGSLDERQSSHSEAVGGDIFGQFWQNCGAFKNLVLFRMDSVEASKFFADQSVDMVFIDGCHLQNFVVHDIQAWAPKCRRLMCGHDATYGGVHDGIISCGYKFNQVPNLGIWRIDFGVTRT